MQSVHRAWAKTQKVRDDAGNAGIIAKDRYADWDLREKRALGQSDRI